MSQTNFPRTNRWRLRNNLFDFDYDIRFFDKMRQFSATFKHCVDRDE